MGIDSNEPSEKGQPGWIMTYADLMTLLMCFFVLMLSFSEMDVAKFKQLAGSMKEAFGVQADIDTKVIPRGTSVIAQEFSPGRPEKTILNTIRQFTVDSNKSTLDFRRGSAGDQSKWIQLAEEKATQLKRALKKEIEEGTLQVRREGTDVIIQILERDSFASGSAALHNSFQPTLLKIGNIINTAVGAIKVSGHTDNIPIHTSQYRSNWELSATRAATVTHSLLSTGIDPKRVMISGHADTQPRAPNNTSANRALNRRIDITLLVNRTTHIAWIDEKESPPQTIQDIQKAEETNPDPPK